MFLEQISTTTAATMRETIEVMDSELTRDATVFARIVGIGRRSFALEGDDLKTFIRMSLKVIHDAGGRPVTGVKTADGFSYIWEQIPEFGVTSDEIADRVITWWFEQERLLGTHEQDFHYYLWFATPEMCG